MRRMNTPGYDFDTAVRRLSTEEIRLMLNELVRMTQEHGRAGSKKTAAGTRKPTLR